MKPLMSAILLIAFSIPAFSASTDTDVAEALIILADERNEMDGPFDFVVCQSETSDAYGSEDARQKTISQFIVKRKGGEIDGIFQANYSVITSALGDLKGTESITKLNEQVVDDLSCPTGTTQVLKKTIQ